MVISNGPGIEWPDGKRLALLPTFDFDVEWLRYSREHRKKLSFADQYRGQYAVEEGLERVLRVLDKHHLKCTFFVHGAVLRDYPDEVKKIAAAGHELAYHGWEHEDSLDITAEEENANMERAEALFLELTGKKPTGARGCFNVTHDFTPELLRRHGYTYSSVMKDADYAYLYPGDGAPLVELPTDQSLDDYTFFFFTFNTPEHRANAPIDYVFRFWKDNFDELADEGDKIMVLKFHPQLIGRASRTVLLDRFLTYAEENGAWLTDCQTTAEYVLAKETEART